MYFGFQINKIMKELTLFTIFTISVITNLHNNAIYRLLIVVRKGFQPLTARLEVWCSMLLSYRTQYKSLTLSN